VPRLALRVALTASAAAALACSPLAQASQVHAGAGSSRRALIQPAATVPAGASVTGVLAASAPVQVTLALTPADPQALAAYAQQVSDPGSPLYRHYLSVGQFAARFGAGASQVAAVRSALTQAGLEVGAGSADGLSLSASGTAAEIEGAFDTQLEHVTLSDGTVAYVDVTDPTLPPAAADAVQNVSGLDTLPAAAPQSLLRARHAHANLSAHVSPSVSAHVSPNAAGPSTCIASAAAGGYTAAEIGSAYGMDGAWNANDLGAGATVGLAELEPYHASDVNAYQACDGTAATVTNVPIDGGSANCWQSGSNHDDQCGLEDVLDIEDVAGLVPNAAIDVYEAPNTRSGLLDLYRTMVVRDVPIISTSWGACEAATDNTMLAAENVIFQEAAVQGEAVFAASGDDGTNDCKTGSRAVDDPASQPYVTGVGGTSMASDIPGAPESVWNDTGIGAGGGGVSREWAQPSYQSGFTQPSSPSPLGCTAAPGATGTSTSCREVPDVSADADPNTGYDIYWSGMWTSAAGTSAAAPTWASLVALADASSACTGSGVRVGFADALLYSLPAADFQDVTTGANGYGGVSGYQAVAGYDMSTGLGAPNGALLLPALCGQTTITAPPQNTQTTTTTPATPTQLQTTTTPAPPTTTTPAPTTTTGTGGSVGVVRFITRRGPRTVRVGRRVHIVLRARDLAGLTVRYSARRLPRGLRLNRISGVISGRPTRRGRSVSAITARDSRGDAETIVIRWKITRR
jgi:subtilase family serine protease